MRAIVTRKDRVASTLRGALLLREAGLIPAGVFEKGVSLAVEELAKEDRHQDIVGRRYDHAGKGNEKIRN